MKTFTITYSRRQIMIETSDNRRWLFQRSNAGIGRKNRRIAALEAAGYTEAAPPPDTFQQLVNMAREGR